MGNGLSFGTARASKGAKEIAKTILNRNDSDAKKCRIVAVTYVRDSNEGQRVVTTCCRAGSLFRRWSGERCRRPHSGLPKGCRKRVGTVKGWR